MNAYETASLASSVHLVCRPRENPDGSMRTDDIGDWRDVLQALPRRIHEWMPRLAEEGVVGADAIFACLGPALEIFSRYSRVEKTSGEVAPLGEYLVHVWAAVSREALSMIFRDPDTAGLEPDARLTAMWLWTLGAGTTAQTVNGEAVDADDAEVDEENGAKSAKVAGFTLEYDAARKIAQGLGVHLEKASSVVEVKGDSARLLSVTERTRHLLGKDKDGAELGKRPAKKQPAQSSLFAELAALEEGAGNAGVMAIQGIKAGATVLDRVHQAMILFGAGRGEALKRFLVEEGVGSDARFWKLAQALSALYPNGGDEKRWVDGVLARKRGLGF
jgi:putative DNA methylase